MSYVVELDASKFVTCLGFALGGAITALVWVYAKQKEMHQRILTKIRETNPDTYHILEGLQAGKSTDQIIKEMPADTRKRYEDWLKGKDK